MSKLVKSSPSVAHSWFLAQLLPIMESLVPSKQRAMGRNKLHRKRKLLWRKLRKLKLKIQNATSFSKVTRLLQDQQDLETELKLMYSSLSESSEAKVVTGMKDNIKVFFDYAKACQKTKARVGPFLDPVTGQPNEDPDYTAQILSDQYSSVFTSPRPEWSVPSLEELFRVDNSRPTGLILTDVDFYEKDIEYVCSEPYNSSVPGPD